jgi:hypothetical protein
LIFITVNFDQVFSCGFLALIDVNVAVFRVGGEDEPMIHLKLGRIFNDVAQMLALFHIAFASIVVVADVGHFFVAADLVVFLPLFEIFHVFEFLPNFRSITMLLRQLPKHVLFLAHI